MAALKLPPGSLARNLAQLRNGPALLRVGMAFLAALGMFLATGAWNPPFAFQTGATPQRDITARVSFLVPDAQKTLEARNQARRELRAVYAEDPEPLIQLRGKLKNSVAVVISATTLEDLDKEVWRQFQPPISTGGMPMTREEQEETFEQFRAAFKGDDSLAKFEQNMEQVMRPLQQHGLLERLQNTDGNQREILVYSVNQAGKPGEKPAQLEVVPVDDVLIAIQAGENSPLLQRLRENPQTKPIADRIYSWLRHRLTPTLTLDLAKTEAQRERDAASVAEVEVEFQPGQVLAHAEQPLGPEQMRLLRLEYRAWLDDPAAGPNRFERGAAMLAFILALFALCGGYVVYRETRLLDRIRYFASMLVLAVAVVGLARWLSNDAWRAEIIPLLLFCMTMAISFRRELALLLSVAVGSVIALTLGMDVAYFVVLMGVVAAAVLQLTTIRSRVKIIRVCFLAAGVAFLLHLALEIIAGHPANFRLYVNAGRLAFWTLCAGFLITGLLPFIEKLFGVLTDLSLLELGDVSHPLLQELVRRAPGTYNHSINVASMAEAAAERIAARGLLVRVGAYFHDIGKMLKPGYFAENQGEDGNRHESLQPAMSTLVIIAHIKDGADLARAHHLPTPIIDFIEQHHGTTLVEFFYNRANEQQQQSDPGAGEVDESAFRYPGPKPQTKEAAVLMLADAVESASRTLTEPAPARIESLVDAIALKRLMDGQFDESGINLQELRLVQDSLVKSLIAVYHGRVKYPDQRTA